MKTVVATSLLVASAAALPELFVSKRDKHTNGATANFARSVGVERRSGTLSTNVYDVLSWSYGGAYYTNVSIGTPPQEQVVILDTGSADLYFDASTAEDCQSSGPHSCQGGTFNPANSKTYKIVEQSPAFNTSFGDGSTATGPYSTDVFGIGNLAISNVQFGVANEVDSTTGYAIGLMGVGYSSIEATENFYPNVPEVLVDAGVINSRLYSVFLNDENDVSGSILFGGIDTSKYTGKLVTLNLLPDLYTLQQGQGVVDQFISVVTGVSASVNGKNHTLLSGGATGINAYKSSSGSLPVLLDTGSTAWSVPQRIYDRYFAPVFTYVDEESGICSCAHANSGDSVSVEFNGQITINVPAREFIVPLYNTTTKKPVQYDSQNEACLFLISPAQDNGEGFQTLGDAVLRSMYVVYDLDNGQVSVAQANTDGSAKSNIVTVAAGPGGVAKAATNVVTPSATQSYQIAGTVTPTASFSVSTASTTLGTATGVDAIPATARVSGGNGSGALATPSGSGSGSSSGSGSGSSPSSSSTHNAAAGMVIPGADLSGLWVTGLAVVFAAVGTGLML